MNKSCLFYTKNIQIPELNQNCRSKIGEVKEKFRPCGAANGMQKACDDKQGKPDVSQLQFPSAHFNVEKLIGKHTLPHGGNACGIDQGVNENGGENGAAAAVCPGKAQACRYVLQETKR